MANRTNIELIVLGAGVFFLLIAGILVGIGNFVDKVDSIRTMYGIGVLIASFGILSLAGGFGYKGINESNASAKTAWFVLAGLAILSMATLLASGVVR